MINGHEKVMLQFSGGKDSLACLWLLEKHWPDLIVAWVNTGDAFPETLAQMEEIKALIPRFLEVKSDQPAQIREHGYPVDLLPVWDTGIGRSITPGRTTRYQPPFACCGENLWLPMQKAVREHGITLVIRGQRNSEMRTGPIRHGHSEDGVQYWFPIENWTEQQVIDFLGERLPKHYQFVGTSLDCQYCTAYLDENRTKLAYVKKIYPDVGKELERRLRKMSADCINELNDLHAVLGEA